MIPNNNLSVLPFYTSLDQQDARKWWMYGRVYPLYCPAGFLLPFQILTPHTNWTVSSIRPVNIVDANTGQIVAEITDAIRAGITKREFTALGYDVWVFPGQLPVINELPNGRYYLEVVFSYTFYSEIFTVVNDIEPYLKITWWDLDDFTMDAGTIVYTNPAFKNVLYLQSDLAKPEYPFEEEGETRDGYFFPTKQISEKRYRFNFLASEYLLDVMRFIRMADFAEIEYHGQKYSLDTFLITPEWEDNGDVAAVEAVFDTATVAKKVGIGYIKSLRGDFNDDFDNDFDNSGYVPEHGTTWYIDRCISTPPSGGSLNNANLVNGGWSYMAGDNALLQGRKINRITLVPSQAGVINIYKTTALTGPVTLVASFTVTSGQVGIKTTYELTEFEIGSNEIFVLGEANSAGGFKYLSDPQHVTHNSFYSKIPSSPTNPVTPGTSPNDLNISLGYYR